MFGQVYTLDKRAIASTVLAASSACRLGGVIQGEMLAHRPLTTDAVRHSELRARLLLVDLSALNTSRLYRWCSHLNRLCLTVL